MTLDRALDGIPFKIDLFRCHEAARKLSGYQGVHTQTEWSTERTESQLAFKTLFISICHQMNWDVLQHALAGWLLPDADRRLDEFAATTPARISQLLSHYPKQERVRARERAAMLRSTATSLARLLGAGGALHRMLADPRLEGPEGYYATIATIDAFRSDPLEKKARVLAHDLFREAIIPFRDPENLRPAVEYHLLRLYLRTGRVYPTSDDVKEVLVGEPQLTRERLVKVLRETVDEAMRFTAFYAGLDVATLNYVEWQIARTICISELNQAWHPLCRSSPAGELPIGVRLLAPIECTYAPSCRSLNDTGYGWYHEPQFEKAIY